MKLLLTVVVLCLLFWGCRAKDNDANEEAKGEGKDNANGVAAVENHGSTHGSGDIFQAIRDNDLEAVKELAKTGQKNATEGKFRFTPLMTAVEECRPEMVRILVENGADILQKERMGFTVLTRINGLNRSLNLDEEQVRRKAEEMRAEGKGEEFINAFVRDNTPRIPDKFKGREKELQEICDYLRNAVEARKAELFKAIETGDRAEVRRLVKLTPLDEPGPGGRTPLMLAALMADIDTVRILLEERPNTSVMDKYGLDVIRQLVMLMSPAEIETMVEGKTRDGNPLDEKNIDGYTRKKMDYYKEALALIGGKPSTERKNQYRDIVACIRKHNSDMMKPQPVPPLLKAINEGDVNQVKMVAKETDLEKPLQDGFTPLFLAAMTGNVKVVEALVDSGASLDTKVAFFDKNVTVAEMIELACADMESHQRQGREELRKKGMTDKQIDKDLADGKFLPGMYPREKVEQVRKMEKVLEFLRKRAKAKR